MKHLALCFMLAARVAGAQPAGAQAEVLFRQGKELLARGQIAAACAAFDESEKLDPTPATLLNQASCREKNGQLATAWGLFLEAERQTRSASDDAGKQMHDAARAHATRLEPRLSTLTIEVPGDAQVGGLEILRDGEVLDHTMWNDALPLDGGTYKLTARAPGNEEWTTSVTIGNERDAKIVEVPRLKSAELRAERIAAAPAHTPEPVRTPPPAPAAPHVDDDAPTSAPVRASLRTPLAIGGASIALLGIALALELDGESTFDAAKANLDPNKQLSLWHTANDERYAAEGLAIAGVAAAGIAAWIYVHQRRTERALALAPVVGGDRAGIQLVGGF